MCRMQTMYTKSNQQSGIPDGANADKRVLVVRVEPELSAFREMKIINSHPLEKIHVVIDLTGFCVWKTFKTNMRQSMLAD